MKEGENMGTSWAEIITDYAMVEIDDDRLSAKLARSPALFFRAMSLYMKNAIPYFSSPPQMADRLKSTPPVYDDFYYTAQFSPTVTVVDSGKIGFEIMSSLIVSRCPEQEEGTAYEEALYNPQTGEISLPAGICDDTEFEFDFYTDGYFENDLLSVEKRILGLCVALVWNTRFSDNWLNMQPKIADKSFSVNNESSHMRATSEKLRDFRAEINAEIRKYEQDAAFMDVVLNRKRFAP